MHYHALPCFAFWACGLPLLSVYHISVEKSRGVCAFFAGSAYPWGRRAVKGGAPPAAPFLAAAGETAQPKRERSPPGDRRARQRRKTPCARNRTGCNGRERGRQAENKTSPAEARSTAAALQAFVRRALEGRDVQACSTPATARRRDGESARGGREP